MRATQGDRRRAAPGGRGAGRIDIGRIALVLLGWALAVIAGLIVLAWLAGRLASDRWLWSQWLLWIPTPAAMIAAALGVSAALRPARHARRRRRRIWFWSLLLGALLLHFAAVEHRLLRWPRPAVEPNDGPGLRMVHWNAAGTADEERSRGIEAIINAGAEIIILTDAIGYHREDALLEWVGEERALVLAWPFTIITEVPLIRRRPIVARDGMVITIAEFDTTEALGRPILLHLVDMPSDLTLPRMDLALEARRLLDEADADSPDIVIGDFNITRNAASLRAMYPGLPHAFDEAGRGYGATYRREWLLPLYHIDHVLRGADDLILSEYRLRDPGVARHVMQIVQVGPVSEAHLTARRAVLPADAPSSTPTDASGPP